MKLIDLTFEIESDMPTCGTAWHQLVEIEQLGRIEDVGRNTARIVLGSHSGTHMDAPYHFIESGKTMEELDINMMCGEVQVVDFRRFKAGSVVSLEAVKEIDVSKRMLFVFGWYHNWKSELYYKSFPFFSEEAIDYLIKKGMKFMALDTPSPDDGRAIGNTGSDSPNHKALLKNEIIIVEYLNNTDILDETRKYEIMAFPLKVLGVDGCPARVIMKEID